MSTECFQFVFSRDTREAESRLFFLMFNDTLRRIGEFCTVRHWIGGAGTFGWISGFEDATCRWSRNTSSLPQDWGRVLSDSLLQTGKPEFLFPQTWMAVASSMN